MKTLLKRWTRRLAVWSAALGVLGLVVGNCVLNSSAIKDRIRSRLVPIAGGAKAEIGLVTWFPWEGLRVRDIRSAAFSAEAFRLDVRLFSVFTRHVRVRKVVCEHPRFHVVRKAAPAGQADANVQALPMPSAEPVPPRVPESAPSPSPNAQTSRWMVSMETLEMERGSLVVVDAEGGVEQMRIEGIEVAVVFSEGSGAQGTFAVSRAQLFGQLEATGGEGELRIEGRVLKLENLSASCRGGRVSGSVTVGMGVPGTPCKVELRGDSLGLEGLVAGNGDLGVAFHGGSATIDVAAQGYLQALRRTAGGRLSIDCAGARLAVPSEMDTLKPSLRTDEEGRVELEEAVATVSFAKGVLSVGLAAVRSGEVFVKSRGSVGASGQLNLSSRLYLGRSLHGALVARAQPETARAFECVELPGADLFYRDLHIVGTIDEPVTDFWRTGTLVTLPEILAGLRFEFDTLGAVPVNLGG